MCRQTASIPKAQQGFLKYICQPLVRAIANVIPTFQVAVDHMSDNAEALVELEAFSTDEIMSAANLAILLPLRAPPPSPDLPMLSPKFGNHSLSSGSLLGRDASPEALGAARAANGSLKTCEC